MIANYHTHTWRCNHAVGREEAYVQAALDRHFEILGFSDHTPYVFPEGYYSGFRMRMDQFQDYCNIVHLLQRKYSGKIQIPLGVEVEYYPGFFPQLLPILQDAGIAKDIVHATARDAIVGGAESVFCIHLQWGVASCLVVENLHLGDACLAYGLGVEIEAETGNLRELTVLHGRIGCGGNKKFKEF